MAQSKTKKSSLSAIPASVEQPSSTLTSEETRELSMVMRQFSGEGTKLTSEHITELIKHKEIAMSYQHKDTQRVLDIEEKKPTHNKQILAEIGVFLILLIFVVGMFDKTYIESIFKILGGFLAGSGVGYHWGKKESVGENKSVQT